MLSYVILGANDMKASDRFYSRCWSRSDMRNGMTRVR